MTPAERADAMRAGDLTLEQLTAWSARHPEQVAQLNGEFAWLTALSARALQMSSAGCARRSSGVLTAWPSASRSSRTGRRARRACARP